MVPLKYITIMVNHTSLLIIFVAYFSVSKYSVLLIRKLSSQWVHLVFVYFPLTKDMLNFQNNMFYKVTEGHTAKCFGISYISN